MAINHRIEDLSNSKDHKPTNKHIHSELFVTFRMFFNHMITVSSQVRRIILSRLLLCRRAGGRGS